MSAVMDSDFLAGFAVKPKLGAGWGTTILFLSDKKDAESISRRRPPTLFFSLICMTFQDSSLS
jgi:hypothetical protein